ncbi:MAG: shikimate dehydrogenase [Puniceicoccaceae bacterium]
MSGRPPEPVRDLRALRSLEPAGVRLAVAGWPVRHSLSPPMHRAALESLSALDPAFAGWTYGAYELRPEELPEAVALFRERGFRGVNLTVPHKVEVLPLVDVVDPVAERMAAVNTLLFDGGCLRGFNSDGYGLERAVEEAFGAGLRGRPVLLLGAGGAARAAAVQCVESGASRLWIANRTVGKAETIAARIREDAPAGAGRGRTPVTALPAEQAPATVPPGTLVINATSLGLARADPLPVEVEALPAGCRLFDMIYNPSETPFLAAGRQRGCPTANGLGMLVHQGVRSLEIWTGRRVDARIMREACGKALGLARTDRGG